MYLGSVRFYKHIIYTAIVIILVLALVGLGFIISFLIPKIKIMETANFNKLTAMIDDMNRTLNYQNLIKDSDDVRDITKFNADKIYYTKHDDSKYDVDYFERKLNNTIKVVPKEQLIFDVFPDLYCDAYEIISPEKKTAYLTFDDGPTENTENILDILREHKIKATFFVVTGDANSKYLHMLKKIVEEGHAVGIHSHTHKYEQIYSSKEAFLEDMNNSFNIIYEYTGIKPTITRFPGGSINSFNRDIYQDIVEELEKRNFLYYDWNVSFDDAKKNVTTDEIYKSALTGIEKNSKNDLIILAHDQAKNNYSLEALKKLIDVLESYGYSFDKMDNSVEPITFSGKSRN